MSETYSERIHEELRKAIMHCDRLEPEQIHVVDYVHRLHVVFETSGKKYLLDGRPVLWVGNPQITRAEAGGIIECGISLEIRPLYRIQKAGD